MYPALNEAIAFVSFYGNDPSNMFADLPGAIKSQLTYQASIYNTTGRYARALAERSYNFTAGDWARGMAAAIETFLTEAWFEGMAQNEYQADEMTPEMQENLDGIIRDEKSFLPDLAAWISETVDRIRPIDAAWPALHARLDVWANRWLDVKNQAIRATSEPDAKEMWVMGNTEQHCETCSALNGLVAYVSEWETAGFRPQSPPNSLLSCGGWRCDCSRVPTTKRRTKKVLDRLLDIAAARSL